MHIKPFINTGKLNNTSASFGLVRKIRLALYMPVLLLISTCFQKKSFSNFINSFKESSKQNILLFRKVFDNGIEMNVTEASTFVYNGDTSKVYCAVQEFNMETETKGEINQELYLPKKCLRLTYSNYLVIGYSSFKCSDPNSFVFEYLTLIVVDKKTSAISDSLIVYRSNEYEWQINGFINPKNGKIFLLSQKSDKFPNTTATIYKINHNLKFEIVEQKHNLTDMVDDVFKNIKSLGWQSLILTQ